MSTPAPGYVDVLIVGAGLSGIGAACHLQALAPGRSFAIVEARAASGGTWDLFRFPGIRSDSDMFTLGYTFRPWTAANAIAGGGQILRYLRDTAAAHGVDEHISYHSRVVRAAWSGADARWTVTIEDTRTGTQTERRCGFLYLCAGYYRYGQGYTPHWPGRDSFAGRVVHPQHWPDDLDLTGQRVVVIGSGATAVTLVPAIAARAAKVTMVQRSPSYVMALPARDPIASLLRAVLPERRAYAAIRWKNARIATTIYQLCRRRPDRAREMLSRGVRKRLPDGYDVATHFTPAYNPWDQRLCLTPDGDFFDALSSGRAEIVTDHIEAFTPAGLRLRSGAQLEADVIITATGLNLRLFGGIELTVDGEPVTAADHIAYKAMMLEGVPNMAFAVGYTNASWTLKVDLVSAYVARIVAFMAASGYRTVTPRRPAGPMGTVPFTDMTSGYFQRARDMLPSQGDRAPWRLRQHFFKDAALYRGPVDTENLVFTGVPAVARRAGLLSAMTRIPYARREELGPEGQQLWDGIVDGRGDLVVTGEGGLAGPFNAFVTAPGAGRRMSSLGATLRFGTSIERRLSEIAIITTGARWQAEFEWWAHAPMAHEHGVPGAVVDAIGRGEDPPFEADDERAVYTVARQLAHSGRLDQEAYDAAHAFLGDAGMVELVSLCGYYTLISFLLNAFDVPLPPDAAPMWPDHDAAF